jgi:hypothetical protein
MLLVAKAQKIPFTCAKELMAATNFPGQKHTDIWRPKETGLRARHAVVKDVLTNEHELYCLAFAEINVAHQLGERHSLTNLHLAQQMLGRL